MTVGPEFPNACVSHIATPIPAFARITPEPVYSGQIPTPLYLYTPLSRPPISSIVMVTSGLAIADPVIVAWQAEDLPQFPSDYQTSLAEKIGVSLRATTPSSSTSPSPGPPSTTNGLSTAAKAGIAIGAVLAAAIISTSLVILRIKRRRKHASTTQAPSITEMEDQDQNNTQRKWFFGGKWRNEVHAEPVQNELDSRHVHIVPGPPAELDGSVPPLAARNHAMERAEDHRGNEAHGRVLVGA
jgi:hypothetical protein